MSEEKLKPCPFCGGEATHKCSGREVSVTVFCYTCNIAIPTEVWQKRVEDKQEED